MLGLGAAALASPAAAQVQVKPLGQLDLFSVGAKPSGIPDDLWKGSSTSIARTVIPLIAAKPLSPAASALARRVLAAAVAGPAGAGFDADLAGARALALLALGDMQTVGTIVDHAPSLGQNARLSQAAAEAALIDGKDDKACAVADGLTVDRDDLYWLKLRAFCQEVAKNPAAGLSLQLAEQQGAGPMFARLMTALNGVGQPGEPALDNGVDYALSRRLGLDLTSAVAQAPSPIVVAILKSSAAALPPPPATQGSPPAPAPAPAPTPVAPLRTAAIDRAKALGLPLTNAGDVDLLAPYPSGAPTGADVSAPAAIALLAAFNPPVIADARADLAGQDLGPSRAAQGRLLALDLAADAKAAGETALLAIFIDAEAEPDGLAIADRARIVRDLVKVGLTQDAQAFVNEGLLAPPPPPPPPAAKPAPKPKPHPAAKPALRKRR